MLSTLLLSALATVSPTQTQSDKAFFAILAETKMMRIAGAPLLKNIPDLPKGLKIPGMEMMSGEPSRLLNFRLWSPSIAPADAFAKVKPPTGLKQGENIDLELYRPSASGGSTAPKNKDFDPDSNPEFTIKIYWGSSETVKEGQPKIIKWTGLTEDQKAAMRNQARDPQSEGDYFYKPNWTTGYWPTKKQPGAIGADASLIGAYALTTNYTGNVTIEAPANVNFLAPIEITQPDLEKKIDLKKAMKFQWNGIPNSLGMFTSVIGMEGKTTLVIWSSSEVFTEALMGDMGFLQMAEVRDFVSKTIFMPGETTKVDVPAGIFVNADVVMMNSVAYGPGSALEQVQPIPRIQTKSTLMAILGGKKMRM